MKIEVMTKAHIPSIAEIEKAAFGTENAEKTLLKELDNKISSYFAATENGETVGYIGIWNVCGEADIINIAVKDEYKRKGIGTFLMNYLFDFSRKNDIYALNLEVRESNTPARAFYGKCGFYECGERKNYYDGKETAVLMRCDIQKTKERAQ